MIWAETKNKRLAYCGRALQEGSKGVQLLATPTADGGHVIGVTGVQSCGSVWACPVCSEKINASRQAELSAGIEAWREGGGSVLFLTATMRHNRGHGLAVLWDAGTPAWNRMTSGAGVAWNGGARELGDRARFGVAGYVRLVEVKHGAHGWHPHVHALLFLEAELDDSQLEDFRLRLFARWERELARHGLSVLDRDRDGRTVGVDLRRVADSTYLADYFAKNGYRPRDTTSAGAAAYEVTGSHSKQLGKGGRSPFGILADVVAHGDEADLRLWHEWETVSSGRRQLTWSRGLRERLRLAAEKSDQEVVDEALEGETVATIPAHLWKRYKLWNGLLDLVEAVESDLAGGMSVEQARAAWAEPERPGLSPSL